MKAQEDLAHLLTRPGGYVVVLARRIGESGIVPRRGRSGRSRRTRACPRSAESGRSPRWSGSPPEGSNPPGTKCKHRRGRPPSKDQDATRIRSWQVANLDARGAAYHLSVPTKIMRRPGGGRGQVRICHPKTVKSGSSLRKRSRTSSGLTPSSESSMIVPFGEGGPRSERRVFQGLATLGELHRIEPPEDFERQASAEDSRPLGGQEHALEPQAKLPGSRLVSAAGPVLVGPSEGQHLLQVLVEAAARAFETRRLVAIDCAAPRREPEGLAVGVDDESGARLVGEACRALGASELRDRVVGILK